MGLYLETDLGQIEANLINLRKLIGERELTLMVKADAYNHGVQGVIEVSKDIVDRYGVATLGEAIMLRRAGVKKPISVFSCELEDIRALKEYSLTAVVYNLPVLDALLKLGYYDFDIKIDSGMCRFGLNRKSDILNAIKRIRERGAKPRALLTHFAQAERIDEQIAVFNLLAEPFNAYFAGLKHVLSATVGIERGYLFDGVRAGLIAYKGALKVCSSVLDVKEVHKGDRVGYDGAFKPKCSTKIAIVSGGYYDGIRRSYSGAEVLINGRTAQIVGKVSMDTTIIDVGDMPISIGDEVIFINAQTIDSYIEKANTNEYEVLTSIKGRAQRIYSYNGKKSYQVAH